MDASGDVAPEAAVEPEPEKDASPQGLPAAKRRSVLAAVVGGNKLAHMSNAVSAGESDAEAAHLAGGPPKSKRVAAASTPTASVQISEAPGFESIWWGSYFPVNKASGRTAIQW